MRADQLLVERRLAASRSQAQRLIAGGLRWRVGAAAPWNAVGKSGDNLPDDAELQLLDDAEARYVSRGGLKLEGALRQSGVTAAGKHCLDVGQSTGGFTDCLLQQGAASVLGLDVGSGQLHPRLRADPRVTLLERVNARRLDAAQLNAMQSGAARGRYSLIVADLSFISLTLVLSQLQTLLAPGGDMLLLIKPQFELQPGQVGKGGIVRDAALHAEVEQRIRACCIGLGLAVVNWFDSPITGGDGNREFFAHLRTQAHVQAHVHAHAQAPEAA
jgi:23S rRNA (cytidine1920-2'-O)/16S rRNA (cytidine1409-2'-O)-methyltransferase